MVDIDRHVDARLEAALAALPRAIEPGRDLWPAVAVRLEPRAELPATRRRPAWFAQAAAAVLLVAGSSLLTARLVRDDADAGRMTSVSAPPAATPATGVSTMPAAFGPGRRLDAGYVKARQQLTTMLESRMANMPDSARAKLQVNLAEMRRAAEEINAALAEQPGDPLLEELLLKTYQDELAVLANVNQMTNALSTTSDPKKADPKKVQL